MQTQSFSPPRGRGSGAPLIGFIGISGYARLLLKSLLATLETEPGTLVAATVINRREEEDMCGNLERQGCTIYSDYREMLEDWRGRLDLCIVPVSIHWHAPICVHALRVGAHVLVEKPLAGSLSDAQAIVEASRSAGKFVAVGFQDVYSPPNREIKRFLGSHKLGRLREIRISGSWPRTKAYYNRNGWAGRLLCDGRAVYDSPLNNAFAHYLNLGLFFASSRPDECANLVQAEGRLFRHFPIESFDTAAVRLTSSEGVSIRCSVTHADSLVSEPEIFIEMERGSLCWKHAGQAVAQSWDGFEINEWSLYCGEVNRRCMLKQILACSTSSKVPDCTALFSLSHLDAIARLHGALNIESRFFHGNSSSSSDPWLPVEGVFRGLKKEQKALKGEILPAVTGSF